MQAFVDSKGREWTLTINVLVQMRIKAATNCNLYTLFDNNAEEFTALQRNPAALCTVAFHMARDSQGKSPISQEDFAEAIDGDAYDRLEDAFTEELIFFSPPQNRELLRTMLTKDQEIKALAISQVMTTLGKTSPAQMLENLLSRGNGSSGNSPAASVSIPANGHSGNSPSPPSPGTAASGSA